jgi:prolipoprotein diacylglyceryl transferase
MFPVLQLGPLSMQTQGLFLLAGLWIGWMWLEKGANTRVQPGLLSNILSIFLLISILSARLIYVAQHLSTFFESPLSIFALSTTMLDLPGGVMIGFIVALIYIQRKKIGFLSTLDGLTPFFMVMQVALGFANLASGEAYGMPTRMPWGFELWGAFRHPSQAYEIIAALIILALVWFTKRDNEADGLLFFRFLALSAAARLFLEAYRGDSAMLTPFLRLPQLAAWLILAFSLWQIGKLIKDQNRGADESQG